MKPVLAALPYMVCPGNHESDSKNSKYVTVSCCICEPKLSLLENHCDVILLEVLMSGYFVQTYLSQILILKLTVECGHLTATMDTPATLRSVLLPRLSLLKFFSLPLTSGASIRPTFYTWQCLILCTLPPTSHFPTSLIGGSTDFPITMLQFSGYLRLCSITFQ